MPTFWCKFKLVFSSIPVFHEFEEPPKENQEEEEEDVKDVMFTQTQIEGSFFKNTNYKQTTLFNLLTFYYVKNLKDVFKKSTNLTPDL